MQNCRDDNVHCLRIQREQERAGGKLNVPIDLCDSTSDALKDPSPFTERIEIVFMVKRGSMENLVENIIIIISYFTERLYLLS